jgi:tRNA G18 (ribose-2'-O)-methylase SpoU
MYQIRQCQQEGCHLRYPVLEGQVSGETCPRCGGETQVVWVGSLEHEPMGQALLPSVQLEALLDNLRSAWNVGSMFRTADGLGMRHLYLCGITPTPENSKVAKTALGAEKAVAWSYSPNAVETARQLKERGHHLWALENLPQALPLMSVELPGDGQPLVLVVGNEVCGVDRGVLELCDRVIFIPMHGIKRSYNAAVAFGIAAWFLCNLRGVERRSWGG